MKIVVVIPCRNEVSAIQECIDAIYASELPENCQLSVFIVDGKSDDGTLDVIKELQQRYTSLKIVVNEKQLTPFAFNLGIKAGTGADYVQIVGARQILSKSYLKKAVETLSENKEIWCIGGRVHNVYLNDTGKIIAKAMGTSLGMGLGNFRTLEKSSFVDTVGTPMYPYWVFDKIGYFDETLIRNQDDDFNFRVHQAGGKIFYEHDISIKYYVRGNFNGLSRQFFQYGYWKVFVNRKHRTVTTIRQLIPPMFVLYSVLLIPIALIHWLLFAISAIPMMLYLVMLIYFSANQAQNLKQFPQLMYAYLILHYRYGLGYLLGIFEFLLLRKNPSDSQKRLSR